MEKMWHYLINQFLNVTARNFKKALKLSIYHDAILKKAMDDVPADPDFALLYNRYHPLHLQYVDAYTIWKNAGGVQEGQTLNITQLMLLLITKINKWDVQVQVVFDKTTPQYKAIFPNGHYPFNSGATDTRVAAVKTLGQALGSNPALLPLKTEVDTFYTTLNDARTAQEGAKGGTKELAEEVDNKRKPVMEMEYRNLGFLINKSADNPARIEAFFETSILRSHQQVLFTGTLDAGENEPVLIHTFVSDDELELEIKYTGTGTIPATTTVQFYLATTAGGTDSTAVNVTVNSGKLKIQASAFNITNYGTHRYLTAINNSVFELHYEVELL